MKEIMKKSTLTIALTIIVNLVLAQNHKLAVISFDAAGATGELFPNMTTGKISSALKKHVFPKIPKEVQDKLLTKPSGYTDLRRITASAIANQLGRPDLASEIISHKGGGDDLLLQWQGRAHGAGGSGDTERL